MNNNEGNMNGNNGGFPQNNGINGAITPQNSGVTNGNTIDTQQNLQGMSLGNLSNLNQTGMPSSSIDEGNVLNLGNLNGANNSIETLQNVEGSNPSNLIDGSVQQPENLNINSNMQGSINQCIISSGTNNSFSEPMQQNSLKQTAPTVGSSFPAGENNMNFTSTPNFFVPNSNGGGNNNIFESVPTPPSMNDFNHLPNNKKPKKISKTTIILLVILLICMIGAGIYFVLTNVKNSKPKGSISLISENLSWELGTDLSNDVSDYAIISGFDKSTCKVDTSKVDAKKRGSYEFTVTCGTTSKSGKIMLDDKTAPSVTVKNLTVVPGTKIQLEDFIVSCVDPANCSYGLESSDTSLDQMTAEEGNYQFNIIVSDDYNNQTTVELNLNVSNNAPVKYMYCTPSVTDDNELNAEISIAYNYGINNDNVLVQTEKIYTYTFDVKEDYLKIKNAYNETNGIQGIVGITSFDDDEFIITITTSILESDLATEFNVSSFSTNYDELKQFNLDQGISCKNR